MTRTLELFPGRPRPRAITLEVRAGDVDAERLAEALLALARASDPKARLVVREREIPWTDLSFVAVDVETTGFHPVNDRVIEVAWVRFEGGREVERFATLVNPGVAVPYAVRKLTGIDNGMLVDKPAFADVAQGLVDGLAAADFCVAYNARFDRGFLGTELARSGLLLPELPWVDPLAFVKDLDDGGHKLSDVARRFGVTASGAHRAEADARVTGELLLKLAPRLSATTLADLLDKQSRWSRVASSSSTPVTAVPAPAPAQAGFGSKLLSLFR